MYKCEIRPWRGTPALFVNDKPCFLAAPYLHKAPYETFAAANPGIYMIFDHSFDVEPPGTVNIERITIQIDALLSKEPGALIIIRTFPPAPAWWLDAHPAEEMAFDRALEQYSDWERYRDASWGSEIWLDAVCGWYRQLCEKLEQKYRGQVIGYQFGMGTAGENNPLGACAPGGRWFCSDFSPAMTTYFRNWLRRKYGTDEKLRLAWGDKRVTLDNAQVPDRVERLKTEWFTFRDPRNSQSADYYQAFAERTQEIVIRICRSIKEATGNRCLAGSHLGAMMDNGFHGYLLHQTCINKVYEALNDPAVDLFTSPASYINRVPGGDANSMMPTGSYTLHNKLIYQDQDTRTHYVSEEYRRNFSLSGIAVDSEETVGVLKRDFAHALIRGYGLWWHAMVPGMYDEPSIRECIARLTEIGRRSLHFERGTASGAAMIVSEDSNFHQECANRLIYPLLYRQRQFCWSRAGIAWNSFLQNDLTHPEFPVTRLYCFLNLFYLTGDDIAVIRTRLRDSGATAVWFYAPGIQSPEGFVPEQLEQLTGFRIRHANIQALPRITITDTSHPYTNWLAKGTGPRSFGTGPMGNDERESAIGPIFFVDDPAATVLGELDCLGEPGFCVKEQEGWTSVYIGAPMLNQYLLKAIAGDAGVHVFADDYDVILPGNSFIMLHAVESGEKTIRLPEITDVYEPYEDREIGSDLKVIKDFVAKHQTRVYFLGSKEEYLNAGRN